MSSKTTPKAKTAGTAAGWHSRPVTEIHPVAGPVRVWKHHTRKVRVHRFCESGGSPPYYAVFWNTLPGVPFQCWSIISKHRELAPAKRACEQYLKTLENSNAKT